MKLNEYQRSRSFFDLVKGHSDFNVKTCFFQIQLDSLGPNFIRENGNEKNTNELG